MRASSTASTSGNSSLRVQLLGQLSSSLAPPPCVFTSFGMRAVDHLHTSLLQKEQRDPRSVFACAEILIKLNFTFRHVSDSGVFSGLTVCLAYALPAYPQCRIHIQRPQSYSQPPSHSHPLNLITHIGTAYRILRHFLLVLFFSLFLSCYSIKFVPCLCFNCMKNAF